MDLYPFPHGFIDFKKILNLAQLFIHHHSQSAPISHSYLKLILHDHLLLYLYGYCRLI